MRTPGSGSIADMGPSSGSESDSDDDVVDAGTVNLADELDDAQSDDTESTSSSRTSGYSDELGGDPVDSGGSDSVSSGSSSGSTSPSPSPRGPGPIDDSGIDRPEPSPTDNDIRQEQRSRAADALDEQVPETDINSGDVRIRGDRAVLSEDAAEEVQAGRRGSIGGLVSDPVEAETVEAPTGSRRFSGIFADPQERPDVTERRNEQREAFRVEAAEELDTTPDNVEISFNEETDEFRATQQLTDDQQRINRLTGGRFESAVEAGSDAREAAADAFSGPLDTATDAATLPGRIFGGAAISGVEATTDIDVSEVEAPSVSAEQALGLGAAGVVTPEPATSVGGGALAAGAALTLGAAELQRRRNSEIEAPQNSEFVQSELDVGAGDVEASEIDPGEIAPASSEIDVGSGAVEAVEVEVPDEPARSPNAEVEAPAVEASNILQGVEQDEVEEEEEDDDVIGGEDIFEPQEDTNELARQTYEQGQYEVERIYGEEQFDRVPERELPEEPGPFDDIGNAGISGVGEPGTFGREGETLGERTQRLLQEEEFRQVGRSGLRFPADGVDAEVSAGVEAQEFEALDTGVGTETATQVQSGVMSDLEAGVLADQRSESAVDQVSDTAFSQPNTTLPDVEAVGFEVPTVSANAFTESTVEANTFESVTLNEIGEETLVEVTETGSNRDRRRPRFGLTDGEIDDLDDIGTAVDDAQFTYELDLPDFLR